MWATLFASGSIPPGYQSFGPPMHLQGAAMVPETHEQDDPSGEILLEVMAAEAEAAERGLARIQDEKTSYFPIGFEEVAAEQPANKRNKNKDWDGSSKASNVVVQRSDL